MSVNNFIPDDGSLWSIRAVDISGNYNQKLNFDASGNAIIQTGNTDRLTINSSGAWTCQGGMTYNNSTNTLTAGTFSGSVSGTATTATNIAGGAGGSIPYQSAVNTTALLANGTAGQVLTSAGTTLAPTWTTISVASPTLTQTEDFIYYSTNPQITASTGGIIGTEITFDIFNNTTGSGSFTQNYTGSFNAQLLSGALQRRGFNFIAAGPSSSSQQYSQQKYSFTNVTKVTWGFVPLGDSLVTANPVTGANITYVLGLMGTRAAFAELTSNSIAWTMDGVNGAGRGVETGWKFVINNVVQYSLVVNGGNMLNRWCRAGFTITYVSGNTATVQGFFTDLFSGTTETTGTYTITGGTGFPNPITTPDTAGIFQSAYSNTGNRYFLIDYCQVEQANLYQIGVGTTQTTGR